MEREIFDITSEPRHQTYRQLLNAGMQCCDRFLFVDIPSPDFGEHDSQFGPKAKALMDELADHLVDIDRSKSWPGSTLGEREGVDTYARVYRFRLDERAIEVLTGAADGLYAWRLPTLPADLSLLRPDGAPWLVNMAADSDAYLQITPEEADRLRSEVPGLELRRHYRH